MTPDEAAITWDDAYLTAVRLLPTISSLSSLNPSGSWPGIFCANQLEGATRILGLPVDWQIIPEWTGYEYGFVDYAASELLAMMFRGREIPQTGNVVFIPDTPDYVAIKKWHPYRLDAASLPQFLDDYPEGIFNGSTDVSFLFEEARLVSLLVDEGAFAHINCNRQ